MKTKHRHKKNLKTKAKTKRKIKHKAGRFTFIFTLHYPDDTDALYSTSPEYPVAVSGALGSAPAFIGGGTTADIDERGAEWLLSIGYSSAYLGLKDALNTGSLPVTLVSSSYQTDLRGVTYHPTDPIFNNDPYYSFYPYGINKQASFRATVQL